LSAERRAVAFVRFLIALSSAARWLDRPRVEFPTAAALDLAAHEEAIRRNVAGAVRRPLAAGERIDPNTASARELERLPRVGPALAERIVVARDQAPFRSADELRRVAGIGAAMAESLAPYLALPATASTAPGTAFTAPGGPISARGTAITAPGTAAVAPGSPAALAAGGTISINTASAAELVALPGIGPALAARIVAYRDTVGWFRNADDVQKVPGIGPALRQRLAPYLRYVP
jgi:competence ComEA-like helix-hairpin-helix protein